MTTTKNEEWTQTVKKNTLNLAFWTCSWLVTLAVVAFGPKFIWDFNVHISSIAILINTIVGIGMIGANIKHINSLDELQKKITLEAMGISLGVAIVGGLSYSMLDVSNVIPWDAEISGLVFLIGITHMIALFIGKMRYQ